MAGEEKKTKEGEGKGDAKVLATSRAEKASRQLRASLWTTADHYKWNRKKRDGCLFDTFSVCSCVDTHQEKKTGGFVVT
jgi:hypothetical protein